MSLIADPITQSLPIGTVGATALVLIGLLLGLALGDRRDNR